MTIWMDMTNSLVSNNGELSDIVRTELMLAKNLYLSGKTVKFSVALKYGIAEIKPHELKWLFKTKDLLKAYSKYKKSKKNILSKLADNINALKLKYQYKSNRHKQDKPVRFLYVEAPYKDGDAVFSCGTYGSKKEEYFNKLKRLMSDFKIVYYLSDFCDTDYFYKELYGLDTTSYKNYLQWIQGNCNTVIYPAKAIQDLFYEKYFRKNSLNIPDGIVCETGYNFTDIKAENKEKTIMDKLGLNEPYILSVSDFDYGADYRSLYQAYCQLALKSEKNIPVLVITGKISDTKSDLYSSMTTNPLVKDKIRFISCSDESELDVLYKNCAFVINPSLYKSKSCTDALWYGKLCLCNDNMIMRDFGKDYFEYIIPHHPSQWAQKISFYSNNKNELNTAEEKIRTEYHKTTWHQAADNIYELLLQIQAASPETETDFDEDDVQTDVTKPVVYYDYSLFDIPWLTGIPRAELILGRQLAKLRDDIRFFAIRGGVYYDMPYSQLKNTLSDGDIDKGRMIDLNNSKMKIRDDFPFRRKSNLPFKNRDIVISLGMNDFGRELAQAHNDIGFKYISTVYDFTPITVPHTHSKENIELYGKFLNQTYGISDLILYGGATAQKDSSEYQIKNGMTPIKSCVLKWGSDIVTRKVSQEQKDKILAKYDIKDRYILTVGTVQPRKNHELLYEAWLELLRTAKEDEKIPQLIICGFKGWKSERFINILKNDTRIRNKVIWITPSDEEIDILYQNCAFTLLPSIYEGWSLTLPESLCYGKFCIAADTPSLVETGEDIVDYANPYDPVEWAQKIKYYYTNPEVLKEKEAVIKEKWSNPTWEQCAQKINEELNEMLNKNEV